MAIPNFKRFKLGETVRTIITGTNESLVEGDVVYIHPENGWLTLRVTTVYTRERRLGKGKVTWVYTPHTLREPYMTSASFFEVFRSSIVPTQDTGKSWGEVKKYAAAV